MTNEDEDGDGKLESENIEDIKAGDWVLSRDQFDPKGRLERKKVVRTFVHMTDKLQIVRIKGSKGDVETIKDHSRTSVLCRRDRWMRAGSLLAGMQVEQPDVRRSA